MSDSEKTIDQTILGETAKIPWKDLQFLFASGKAIFVDGELDLVDVATQITKDNTTAVEQWMNNKQVIPMPDDLAKTWYEEDAIVWAVVVKPWVLVQPIRKLDS
jgi:hypothetical protein